MKKSIFMMPLLLVASIILAGCRETKPPKEDQQGEIERVVDEAEDGVKRAGEEIKGAYKDVKEEVDGETDDN